MDSDIIITIVGMGLAIFLGWFENRIKAAKAKRVAGKTTHARIRRTPAAPAKTQPHKAQPRVISHLEPMPPKTVKTPAPTPFLTSEEGVRVTRQVVPEHTAAPKPAADALRPLDHDALRNAVIWGEILQRKF